jgi:translocation and assembly module TamA
VGLAAFTDVGNAFDSFKDYDLHQGAGVGMRFKFPFGVLRTDVAWAMSEPGKPWRLHLTIGPDL